MRWDVKALYGLACWFSFSAVALFQLYAMWDGAYSPERDDKQPPGYDANHVVFLGVVCTVSTIACMAIALSKSSQHRFAIATWTTSAISQVLLIVARNTFSF